MTLVASVVPELRVAVLSLSGWRDELRCVGPASTGSSKVLRGDVLEVLQNRG